jgi:ATP/maltotriose-dependent transcriptional regulator MalT
MPTPILATKLYIPPLRPHVVLRSRLLERLNEGLYRKLTLIAAPLALGKPRWSAHGWLVATSRWPGYRWTKGIATRHSF